MAMRNLESILVELGGSLANLVRTVIYVVSGALRIECGAGGTHVVEGGPGDFVRVPPGAIHRESNPADDVNRLVVVRVGHGVPTVNVGSPAG